MNLLEKLLFLELTNKQFTKLPTSDYLQTYEMLSPREKEDFVKYSREIHDVWSYINSTPIEGVIDNKEVNSVFDYHSKVAPMSDLVLKICGEFNLYIKTERHPQFKEFVVRLFGTDFYKGNFEK